MRFRRLMFNFKSPVFCLLVIFRMAVAEAHLIGLPTTSLRLFAVYDPRAIVEWYRDPFKKAS